MPVLTPYVHTYDRVDPRLGRIVVHDPRSWNYPLPRRSRPTTRISWARNGKVFDQGQLGMCTATAGLGLAMTAPFSTGQQYDEFDCQQLYREETRLDDSEIPGHWEPTDTGSSGLWLMKAMQARGLIGEYLHAFDLDSALGALVTGPIAVGSIWLRGMSTPDRSTGVIPVNKRDRVVGGHEYVIDGYDPATDMADMTNSWGTGWSINGRAKIRAADLGWLLSQQGDVVQPTVAAPAPPPPPPAPSDADAALVAAFDAFAGQFTTWRASRPWAV